MPWGWVGLLRDPCVSEADCAPIFPSRIGDNVHLTCPFRGNPEPKFLWTFNASTAARSAATDSDEGNYLDDELDALLQLSTSSSLVIQNASLTDAGMYYCQASNVLGSDYFQTQLVLSVVFDEEGILS